MRELIFESGGRVFVNEDFEDIQENIKAIEQLFINDDPFVITGCELTLVAGSVYDIATGFVWLGDRIRKFAGAEDIDLSTTKYLNAINTDENRIYNDTFSKIAVTDYGCEISGTFDSTTNSLAFTSSGAERNYTQHYIGSRALLKNPTASSQTVAGDVDISGALNAVDGLQRNGVDVVTETDAQELSNKKFTDEVEFEDGERIGSIKQVAVTDDNDSYIEILGKLAGSGLKIFGGGVTGTWTPSWAGSPSWNNVVYTTQEGYYFRLNDLVVAYFSLEWTHSSPNSNGNKMSLPLIVKSGSPVLATYGLGGFIPNIISGFNNTRSTADRGLTFSPIPGELNAELRGLKNGVPGFPVQDEFTDGGNTVSGIIIYRTL